MPPVAPLPIDAVLPEVLSHLEARRRLVLVAEPGAGKTTRLPASLLSVPWLQGHIVVLEPRRIAARLAAERVSAELGERVGERVGYQTRTERAVTERTRLHYITEGILTRRLLSDPTLRGVGAVILDELHERHLATDLSLALLRRLVVGPRSDLVLCAMSATLDAEAVARFLDAPVVSAPGRTYPVDVEHAPKPDDRPLAPRVAAAVAEAVSSTGDGHVLVFLPGAREIRFAAEACAKLAERRDLAVVPLHGSLPPVDQDRALRPSRQRKVILATNVAETSVTIEDVSVVVDSGLAFVAHSSPWTGLPALRLSKVSRASAVQRAGRAGRTRAGRALRLFTASDFAARPSFDVPEIARADLSEAMLEIIAHGVDDPGALSWLEPPPPSAVQGALALLRRLGAGGGETPPHPVEQIGPRQEEVPPPPPHARVVVEAERRGVARDACAVAAILAERAVSDGLPSTRASERSDLSALVADLDARRRGGLDPERAGSAQRTRDRLARLARDLAPPPLGEEARETALLVSILAGFPDRVARLRRPDARGARGPTEVLFASGATAVLSEASRVREGDLVVAADVEERIEGTRTRTVVRLASGILADWLLELYTDEIADEETLEIPPGGRRVEAVRALRYGSLVLERTRAAPTDLARASEVLARAVVAEGLPPARLGDLDRLAARVALIRAHAPEVGLDELAADLEELARDACAGLRSLDDALALDWAGLAEARLPAEHRRALRELAPERITLASGRQLAIEYARGTAPSVSSRLQDFFGSTSGPALVHGRVPVVLHLLAPNGRDVQVTTDLEGFWERHYPSIARELRRRYPRHAWPDDPRTAAPPAPRTRGAGSGRR